MMYSTGEEILTAKEVAEYLKMNERTIYKLAQHGEIPTIKVAHQWRFRRSMIDSWLDLQMSHHADGNGNGSKPQPVDIALSDTFEPQGIHPNLKSETREDVLDELVDLFCDSYEVSDRNKFEKAVREREQLCSTALYEEVALPHPRYNGDHFVKEPALLIGCSHAGLDFNSLDGKPTRLFFMLCAPNDAIHLLMMAKLCRLLTLPEIKEQLVRARTRAKIISVIKHQEELGKI